MKIGQKLLERKLITAQELDIVLGEQTKTKERLGDIAIKMGFISTAKMAPFLAEYFGLPFIDLKKTYKTISAETIRLIPEELAHRFLVMPLECTNNILQVAMFDPLDVVAEDTIKLKTGLRIRRAVACEADILEAIDYCYHLFPRLEDHVQDFVQLETGIRQNEDYEKLRIEATDPPVVKYVNSLIMQAINSNASDIHLQPKQNDLELRLRIDGVLYPIDPPPKSMFAAISTRIKILANLDIAEHRLPQDGRFKLRTGASEVDIRTSCFPTIYGESIVLRLLNTSSPLLGLEGLGLSSEDAHRYRDLIHRPYGLILVTGPTGSGKTTTLYTSLNEIKSKEKNIITLEDPVEYRLPFIQQSQINSDIGFDFARGLRSILRQDPDVIMVGEIRDRETAEIAIHASLTGHLVFSTLHTNDAAGATVRLVNMGVEPFLITSSLLAVVAQRLVRRICPNCRKEYQVSKEVLKELSLDKEEMKFYKGVGCTECLQSGYKGRIAIIELLTLNESLRTLILTRPSNETVKQMAQKHGMKTLREHAIDTLKAGITTADEVIRVTQITEEL